MKLLAVKSWWCLTLCGEHTASQPSHQSKGIEDTHSTQITMRSEKGFNQKCSDHKPTQEITIVNHIHIDVTLSK